jgi:trans-aconitate methyltransferase
MNPITYFQGAKKAQSYYITFKEETIFFRQFLKQYITLETNDGLLVDLGSGPGTSYKGIAEEFNFKKVFLLDSSVDMIELAKKHKDHFIEMKTPVADLNTDAINIESSSATLVSAFSLCVYLSDLKNIFSEVSRILKPGGYFAFTFILHQNNEMGESQKINHIPEYYLHSKTQLKKYIANCSFSDIATYALSDTHYLSILSI